MDMNIQKHMAFVKTVEYGSFTKAAEILNYSQSGISRMINDLERDWKVTLLERGKAGVRLTSEGMRLLPYAKNVCAEYEKLLAQVDEINGVQSGLIRIGTFSSVAINWLPNIFARFQKDYPGIDYEMLLGDYKEVERWIEDGRVECGFLSLPTTSSGMDTISLKEDEYKVVLPTHHPLTKKERIDIRELEGEPFLLLEHGGKTEVSEILETNQVHPKIRFTTWEDYAIMAMVEKGKGIGILPDMILKRIPYKIEVRSLKEPYYREIGLAMKNRNRLTPVAQKFIEFLKYREEIYF